jgi:hypothetical protein
VHLSVEPECPCSLHQVVGIRFAQLLSCDRINLGDTPLNLVERELAKVVDHAPKRARNPSVVEVRAPTQYNGE